MKRDVSLTKRFEDALIYANQVHSAQVRKSTTIPYVSHLLGVSSLVIEDGGDEDQAIAALLHDAVEDQGGRQRLEDIKSRFGGEVGRIVAGCSENRDDPDLPWCDRKARYIENLVVHVEEGDSAIARVTVADKLHNCRALVTDVRREGIQYFRHFNADVGCQIWFYRSIVEAVRTSASRNVPELDVAVGELERLCQLAT